MPALCVFAAHPPQPDSKVLLLLQAQSQPLLREASELERERGRGRQAERMRGGGERAAVFEWGKEHGCFHLVIYFALSLSSPVSLYQTKYTFRC